MPGADVGLAIIAVTVVVKLVLLPLSLKAAHTQHAMRFLEPELARIKELYKDKKEELAKKTMAAYKDAGINPLASIALALAQIPVIFALYFSVYSGGGVKLPEVNVALLYSFVPSPEHLNMRLFGSIDIASKSMVLAVLAGLTQYVYGHLSLPPLKPKAGTEPNFKEDLTRSMQMQMKYVMPIIIVFVAYTISAAVALYFVISNVMSILQEFAVRRKIPNRFAEVPKDAVTAS